MTGKVCVLAMIILAITLMAVLSQAGISVKTETASFWAVIGVAEAMALVGFLWGSDA